MTSFVLVPGAGGGAWYWHRVVPLLQARGHTAVAVQLPAGDDGAGLADYADAIVAAAGSSSSAGRADGGLVLVAQSMGGLSAPLTCDRLPVREIVLVNAMIPAPGETGGAWWTATGQDVAKRELDVRDGRDPDAEFDLVATFFHDVPADVTAEATRSPEQPQSGTPFGDPWPLPAWPPVPTRVLCGRDDRLFPADFQVGLAKERLGLDATVVPGGHLLALSQPATVVDFLLR
ncbi:alpha/beta fold hydrolase [Dactylosporangium sp. NPDC051541]|uniref:alpha/beta fold hydrolase n=1 Tax=Dactylosporangium sp. NPDC051541 TaxID=3363977 RepID=UPI0037A2B1B3